MIVWWIIGCTALAIIIIGWFNHHLHKRFDKIDRDHAMLHDDIEEEKRLTVSARDNEWYHYETIRGHILSIIGWERKS